MYQLAIDIYLFSYLCFGANVEDIARFKHSDIKHEDGINFIQFYRKKTKNSSRRLITIPLINKAIEIIKRHHDPKRKYLFPILKNHQEGDSEEIKRQIKNFEYALNKRLQRVAKKEGITKHITIYTARHSAGTIGKRSGASLEEMADLFGHSDTTITKNYTRDFFAGHLVKVVEMLDF
jgi:integrase